MPERPFIPVPYTASITVEYTGASVTMMNRWFVTKAENFNTDDLDVLIGIMVTWLTDHGRYAYSNAFAVTRLIAKAQHSDTGPIVEQPLGPSIVGLRTSVPLPTNSTFCIKLNTGLAGRSYRGRWYPIGLTYDMLSSATEITLGQADAYTDIYHYWQLALAAHDWVPVVVSYRHDKAWRTVGVPTPIIAASYVDLALDSQRRRLLGRGHT